MNQSKKCGDTSVRVLETLKFLCKNNASIQDIIHHFEKIDPNNRTYTNEVILKYINTLKVSGYRFIKQKDKYVLLNSPNQFNFDEKDLKTIFLVEKLSNLFPEEKIKSEINQFLQTLERRFCDNTRILSHNMTRPDFTLTKLDFSKYLNQIKEYEQYCLDGQKLKIIYEKQKGTAISIMAEPNEIKYIGNEIYLSVYNPLSARVQNISFNSIIKIEQLPLKSNQNGMFASVTFLLKDRLAKNYKLHEGEKLLQVKPDESIVILNQKEDATLLLKRLMRYGENCEVISPKNIREEMSDMVQAILRNYQDKIQS